jgi:hypothetical protein
VDFALGADGGLTFTNAAVEARVATPATEYRVRWARFDNATGSASGAIDATATTTRVAAPPQLLDGAEFIQAEIASQHPEFNAWSIPVTVHFRRHSAGWTLVGVVRSP